MNSLIALALALTAPAATAFQSSAPPTRPSSTLQNALRDMASYPDDMKMMGDFEAFDRNGAFSRSPQGGMNGRPDRMMPGDERHEMMMGGPNGYSRRQGGDFVERMYTQDGFDPYSAFSQNFGMSQSDRRGGGGVGPRDEYMGMGGPPPPGMMGPGGMGGGPNNVRADNTMGGFSYSSRVRDYGGPYGDMGGDMMMGGPQDGGMMMGPQGMGGPQGGFDGPMGMGGGMEYDQGYGPMGGGGGYGGLGP